MTGNEKSFISIYLAIHATYITTLIRFNLISLALRYENRNFVIPNYVIFLLFPSSRGSSVSIVTTLQYGRLGLHFRQGHGFVLFTTASRPFVVPLNHLSKGYRGMFPRDKAAGT